jgi:glycogen synthase kinase 3 beta
MDLLSRLLEWDPSKRISGLPALMHSYFDELREEGLLFPNGNCLPDVLNLTAFELGENPEPLTLETLIPDWYLKQKNTSYERILKTKRQAKK